MQNGILCMYTSHAEHLPWLDGAAVQHPNIPDRCIGMHGLDGSRSLHQIHQQGSKMLERYLLEAALVQCESCSGQGCG